MGQGPRYRVAFRRRREGRTDYRRRLALLKSGEARLVVRRSLKNVSVQIVTYDEAGDVVRVQADATDLKDHGYKGSGSNIPAAYLTGLLAGKRALEAGIDEAVLDIGLQKPHKGGVIFAALKGMVDAGVWVPHGEDVIPDESRLNGEHVGKDGTAASVAAAKDSINASSGTTAEASSEEE